jgi:hypothetical protein
MIEPTRRIVENPAEYFAVCPKAFVVPREELAAARAYCRLMAKFNYLTVVFCEGLETYAKAWNEPLE